MPISDAAISGPLARHSDAAPARLSLPMETGNCEGALGTSSGVNISPGSDDDGWIVPPPVALSDGTKVQLYKDGEALHAAYEGIKNARRRICLEVYIFANDATGKAFNELLCEKASQGVPVYLIYDALGSLGGGGDVFDQLRKCGGRVEPFHPIFPWELKFSWRPWNRDHRKLLIIDDEIAGLGGLNIGHSYAGSWVVGGGGGGGGSGGGHCDLWRDNAMSVSGPGAQMFLEAFAASWRYVTRGGRVQRAEYLRNVTAGELGILASVPTVHSPLRPTLHQLMADARESIQLTMAYFAPDDPLVESLCKASKRGVRVQLMLPGRSDVLALRAAARSFYEKLMSNGVEVYERQTVVLHAKTMVIDGFTTLLGSTNLDYRSIEYNLELSAIVRSREFGRQVQALFENDVKFGKRMNLSEWRRRPTLDRIGQWAVSRARYLL
jgi:cardiolipin synthase